MGSVLPGYNDQATNKYTVFASNSTWSRRQRQRWLRLLRSKMRPSTHRRERDEESDDFLSSFVLQSDIFEDEQIVFDISNNLPSVPQHTKSLPKFSTGVGASHSLICVGCT